MKGNITIPCNRKQLAQVRLFIHDELKEYFDEKELNLIILSIDEICANIIIHEFSEKPCQDITVEYELDEPNELLTFKIIHQGSQFDYSTYKEPNLSRLISQKRKGGVGLLLVNRIMDSVKCTFQNNNCVTLLSKNIGQLHLTSS